MRAPFAYFGGKSMLAKKLLEIMPPHDYYVEPFCGSAALFFAKKPAKVETLNDIDGDIVNFYRVLRDPDTFKEFRRLATLTPISRAEFDWCRENYMSIEDPVKRAWAWWYIAQSSFSGDFAHSWRRAVTKTSRGMAGTTSRYLSMLDLLPQIADRLRMAQIECSDFRTVLKYYSGPGYLAYCDPPYVSDTRKSGKYKYEMSLEDHRDLVGALLEYDGGVMLSGYDHPVYKPLEDAGWEKRAFRVSCFAVARTLDNNNKGADMMKDHPRTEVVWLKTDSKYRQLSFF